MSEDNIHACSCGVAPEFMTRKMMFGWSVFEIGIEIECPSCGEHVISFCKLTGVRRWNRMMQNKTETHNDNPL